MIRFRKEGREQPAHKAKAPLLPFPPEVVEPEVPLLIRGTRDQRLWRAGYSAALSALADYLQSDEVRERVAETLKRQTGYSGIAATYQDAADAVIAAILEKKT